ncbi:hypothetical protein KEM54_004321 [Ascosphaera aggregata]|nr:hypothetical protein KEM54_004321 [Ascosphaera aggregata]
MKQSNAITQVAMQFGSDTEQVGASQESVRFALELIWTFSPLVLVISFLVSFVVNSILAARQLETDGITDGNHGPGGKPLPKRPRITPGTSEGARPDFSLGAKTAFKWLNVGILLTYIADGLNAMSHAILERKQHWWSGQAFVLVPWGISLPLEVILLGASLLYYGRPHHDSIVDDPIGGALHKTATPWEVSLLVTAFIRTFMLCAVVLLYGFCSYDFQRKQNRSGTVSESTPLLQSGDAQEQGESSQPQSAKPTDNWVRPTKSASKTWWQYLSGYAIFFPYLWPSKSRRLQLTVLICFVLLMLQRIVNVLVPYQVGVITDELSDDDDFRVPWGDILLYIFYRWLQGNQGLIGSLRSFLWIPVGQYSYMELSTAAFEHVHSLSLEFHLGKKTGEVLSALSKGSSINTFLEQVTFQVVPMLIDLCVAIGFFAIAFDIYCALVVTVITFIYLYVTIRLAQWRTEVRRQMANASRQEDAVKNDSMTSYETVKYFNAETYEFNRYRGAVSDYQKAEYSVLFSLNLMNTCQNTVFMLGLLITCFIAAFQVATGERPVGQFITLLTYMAQLQGPLNFFGTFYRSIQNALINSERMLELFREQPSVVDSPAAKEMDACKGDVVFSDVQFAYDSRRQALDGLNFHCEPGTTTALVGESGGGKSTVFRLLFRFYDANSGDILVDGQSVNEITIDSLRRQIGVVPQDTVLFNETLMYNLKYANPAATDEQVFIACRAASIHDQILAFPDGYNTKVGERGLRLSGGEKQRVAIARTILKNPRIILLDEATAALDTATEENIQEALSTLSKGRTLLVIAHRLSTITTADQILVLGDGKVVEKGTHEELLAQKGTYASMWRKQIRAQKAAAEAKVLRDQAEQLDDTVDMDESPGTGAGRDPFITSVPVRAYPYRLQLASTAEQSRTSPRISPIQALYGQFRTTSDTAENADKTGKNQRLLLARNMASKRSRLESRSSEQISDDTATDEASALLRPNDYETNTGVLRKRPLSFWRQLCLFIWATIVTAALIILAVYYQHVRGVGDISSRKHAPVPGKRNLIFMVSDGMGPASLSLTRSFRQYTDDLPINDTLVLDQHLIGSSRTRSSSSLVTDSAAGATAFACGQKSYNGAISVLPDHTPCGTVLEAAKLAGYMTGLVVTTRITDATPACFASHANHRKYEDLIAEHEIGLYPLGRVVDLMLGGGRCHFLPNTTTGSCRNDNKDVVKMAQEQGFLYLDDRAGFDALNNGSTAQLPLLGLFANGDIPYEIDRRHQNDIYPSLEETTRTALKALSKATEDSDRGFFIMIEGSRIDHAGHGNDPAAQVHEVLAYDRAFAAVLEFIENEDTPTIVVSTSDHETGGLSLARQLTEVYPEYRWYPEVLAKANYSSEFLAVRIEEILENSHNTTVGSPIKAHIKHELIEKGLGITDITDSEIEKLVKSYDDPNTPPNLIFADIISRRAQVGWSSQGHSAVDVNIYASSVHDAPELLGNHENTEVGDFLSDYLAVDVDSVTKKLLNMKTHSYDGSAIGEKGYYAGDYPWLGPSLGGDYRVDALDRYHGEHRKRDVHGTGCRCGDH